MPPSRGTCQSPGFLFPRHRLVSSGGRAAKPVAATHGTRCAVGGGTVGGAVVPRRPVPQRPGRRFPRTMRSEEHTSELQSLMRHSYAVFCLKKKNKKQNQD